MTERVEEDRVVGRRVDNGTTASEADERAYAAADPLPGDGAADGYRGQAGGVSDRDVDPQAQEPQRSE
jgi:hypothetical protein